MGLQRAVWATTLLVFVVGTGAPHGVLPSLSPLAGTYLDPGAAGEEGRCARDTTVMEEAAANRSLWAVAMLDASARGASGTLQGLRYQLGSYDGCLSAAASSPVGARYCLASLRYRDPLRRASSPPRKLWELVMDLPPHQDVADVLSGEGMVAGSLPLGDVRVALCVPRSCDAALLQRALRASLEHQDHVDVAVHPEHCYTPAREPLSMASTLFWGLLATLTVVSIAAPALGWSSWDWRKHMLALGLPDRPMHGLDLSPLSGIRAINAMYLVALHRGIHAGRVAFSSREMYTSQARRELAVLYRGVLGVDTFFFLAGLLMAVSSLNRPAFGKSLFNRVVRVVPVYAVVVLFHCTALPDLGAGPLWKDVAQPMSNACRRWWWSNLLFVNNYVHGGTDEHMCMDHSWSLAVDMQMFVGASLLMGWLPAGLSGVAVLAGLAGLATLPLSLGTLLGGWPGTVPFTLRVMQEGMFAEPLIHLAYTPTHMRAAPYLVGLAAGRALLLLKDRGVRLGHAASLGLSLASVAGLLAVIATTGPFLDLSWTQPPVMAALCAGLAPFVWAAILAALIASLVLGEQTVVRSLLSWQPLVTLSRLTFAVYLISYPLQAMVTASERNAVHINVFNLFAGALADSVLSFALSFWVFVVLEAPLRTMAKKALSERTGDQKSPPVLKPNGKVD